MDFLARPGANLPRVRDFNSRIILDAIRRVDGISRVELTKSTGLSPQTVSNQVNALLGRDLISEGEKVGNGPGKPRTKLALNSTCGYAVGVLVDPAQTMFALVDLKGEVIEALTYPTAPQPEAVVELIAQAVEELIRVSGVQKEKILGVGVAAPGPVNLAQGRVLSPPNLDGWGSFPLRDKVQEKTGFPTYFQKDTTAALGAELWRNNQSASGTTVFVYVAFGVGVAFSNAGRFFSGASGNTGEIMHLKVTGSNVQCECGEYGCLEVVVSPRRLARAALPQGTLPADIPLNTPTELQAALMQLVERANAGETSAREVVDNATELLAQGILEVVNLVDAETVVIGGPMWACFEPRVLDIVSSLYAKRGAARDVHPLAVLPSDLGEWVGAAGAACVVLDDAFSPRPSDLTLS